SESTMWPAASFCAPWMNSISSQRSKKRTERARCATKSSAISASATRRNRKRAPPLRPRGRAQDSAQLTLYERYLVHLRMHDRTVPEEALLAEQLAVVGGDRDEGVLGAEV